MCPLLGEGTRHHTGLGKSAGEVIRRAKASGKDCTTSASANALGMPAADEGIRVDMHDGKLSRASTKRMNRSAERATRVGHVVHKGEFVNTMRACGWWANR